MIDVCPKCGATAVLVESKDDFEEIPDLSSPTGKIRVPIKIEEYRCQEPECEHEFEEIIREPPPC